MVRLAIVVGLLTAACGARTGKVAWPKSSGGGDDGGESLAPRSPHIVAIESSDDDEIKLDLPEDKPVAKDTSSETPKETKPAEPTKPDDPSPITTEDIVIEIDD